MNTLEISIVLHEATRLFVDRYKEDANASAIANCIGSLDFSNNNLPKLKGQIPDHVAHLETAISEIDDAQFAGLKTALTTSKGQLHWKTDDDGYYADGADVGEGYRTGNMHTLLVGPENAVVTSNTFLFGLFLLTPWTLYRDHKHLAPEIYVPLTGPSGWRFGLGEWEDHGAGSKIFNEPEVVHATRVYETPFLALFAWTHDIHSVCTVVPAKDWTEVEDQLGRHYRHNG